MEESRRDRRARRRWEREMEHRLAELDRVAARSGRRRSHRLGRGRTVGPVLPGLLVSGVLAGAVMLHDPSVTGYRFRELVDGLTRHDKGSYSFILKAPGGEPVSWSHCEPIPFVVNPRGAPGGWAEIVRDGVADVSRVSGFTFDDEGTTTDRTFEDRGALGSNGQPAPVIIAWASPAEVPDLSGETAGIGGSTPAATGGRLHFVTGIVVLDADAYGQMEATGRERAEQLILEHELGHVLGLDHVADPTELMNAEYVGQDGFGPGDTAGLKRLHDLPCP